MWRGDLICFGCLLLLLVVYSTPVSCQHSVLVLVLIGTGEHGLGLSPATIIEGGTPDRSSISSFEQNRPLAKI